MIVWRSELDRKLKEHKDENKRSHSQHDGRFGELILKIKERDGRIVDLEDRMNDLTTKMQYMSTILDQLQSDNKRIMDSYIHKDKKLSLNQLEDNAICRSNGLEEKYIDALPATYTDIEKAKFYKKRQEERDSKRINKNK